MAFNILQTAAGHMPIANIDLGFTPPGSATVIPTPPLTAGCVVRGDDPTFGHGEFILLSGTPSTVVGSLVSYNDNTFLTTLAPVTANLGQPVAIAMSANNLAATWGWYQIGGCAVVSKSVGVSFAPRVALGINSIGKVGASASGRQILGAKTANAATVASATTTIRVMLDRPHAQGRVT